MVLQRFSVKLIDGFAGSCGSCLPQYLTNAMLLGALQQNCPSAMVFEVVGAIKSFAVIMAQIYTKYFLFLLAFGYLMPRVK